MAGGVPVPEVERSSLALLDQRHPTPLGPTSKFYTRWSWSYLGFVSRVAEFQWWLTNALMEVVIDRRAVVFGSVAEVPCIISRTPEKAGTL